jgi:DNA-binding CsgD family transcriptional regulator
VESVAGYTPLSREQGSGYTKVTLRKRPLQITRLTVRRTIDKGTETVSIGEQYLTIAEVAERLKLSPKTIKNKMASGAFRQGVHYFRPRGMQARFKWSAVVSWLERCDQRPEVSQTTAAPRTTVIRGLDIGD